MFLFGCFCFFCFFLFFFPFLILKFVSFGLITCCHTVEYKSKTTVYSRYSRQIIMPRPDLSHHTTQSGSGLIQCIGNSNAPAADNFDLASGTVSYANRPGKAAIVSGGFKQTRTFGTTQSVTLTHHAANQFSYSHSFFNVQHIQRQPVSV